MRTPSQRFLKFTQFSTQKQSSKELQFENPLKGFLPSGSCLMTGIGSMSCEKVVPSQGDNNRITGWTTGSALAINNRPKLLTAALLRIL